jgi:hypothetical protein
VSIVPELWANPPATLATVSSGGTTAPAQGTSQSWTMAGGYASFPAASSAANPPNQFHVIDPAAPTEIIAVTNVSGSTWTVTRGAGGVDGTTPVVHAAGFAVQQVVTAGGLGQLVQGPPSGDGLSMLNGSNDALVSAVNTAAAVQAAGLAVPGGEAIPGSVYELEAWGLYGTNSTGTVLTFALTWGAVTLGTNAFTMPVSQNIAAPARWRFKASVEIFAGPVAGVNARLEIAPSNAAGTAVAVYLFGSNATGGLTVVTATGVAFELNLNWTTANAANGVYVMGGKAWKAA